MRIAALTLLGLATAAAPATAQEPVTSVSVTVTIGGEAAPAAPVEACTPLLSMAPAKRIKRRGTHRFVGSLSCAPAGTLVEGGDAPVAVGADGRVVARVTIRRSRTVSFRAAGLTVSVPVRLTR
jgi:hypothetical protein